MTEYEEKSLALLERIATGIERSLEIRKKKASGILEVTGKIEKRNERGDWHEFFVNGSKYATKKRELIYIFDDAYETEATVTIVYSEQVNGKYTNRYAESVKIVGYGNGEPAPKPSRGPLPPPDDDSEIPF